MDNFFSGLARGFTAGQEMINRNQELALQKQRLSDQEQRDALLNQEAQIQIQNAQRQQQIQANVQKAMPAISALVSKGSWAPAAALAAQAGDTGLAFKLSAQSADFQAQQRTQRITALSGSALESLALGASKPDAPLNKGQQAALSALGMGDITAVGQLASLSKNAPQVLATVADTRARLAVSQQEHRDTVALREQELEIQRQRLKIMEQQSGMGDTGTGELASLNRGIKPANQISQGEYDMLATALPPDQIAKLNNTSAKKLISAVDTAAQFEALSKRSAELKAKTGGFANLWATVAGNVPRRGATMDDYANAFTQRLSQAGVSSLVQKDLLSAIGSYAGFISGGKPTVYSTRTAMRTFAGSLAGGDFPQVMRNVGHDIAQKAAREAGINVTPDVGAVANTFGGPDITPGKTTKSPSVGTVEDGYEYIGGDPASPNSWRKK